MTVKPVSRRKVALGAAVFLALVAALVSGTEALRYPHATGAAPTAPDPTATEPEAELREPVPCPDPVPREGLEREEDPTSAVPRQVTSSRLYDCPQSFDGQRVRYEGEVVGAVLRRDDGAWVHLNDDVYATTSGPLPTHRDFRGGNAGIGVFIPHHLADEIRNVGGPRQRGDLLEVVGTFHRVDQRTLEAAIIRASEGTITPGTPIQRPFLPLRRTAALIAAALALAVVVAEHRSFARDADSV